MITDLYITNSAGSTLNLNLRTSKDDHGILVFNLTGLGSPKATVTGLTGPGYDGVRGYFVKADARHLILTLAVPVRGVEEEFAKDLIYDHFQVKGEIIFRVKTESEDRWVMGIVESVEMNQLSKVENAVISIYCPDPWFIDSLESFEYASYGGVTQTLDYEGDVPVGANILITNGPPYSWGGDYESMGTLTLSNDREDQSLVWPFVSFGEFDKFLIYTMSGQKEAWHCNYETNTWTNITTEIIASGEWLKLHPGDNDLTVELAGTYQGPMANMPDVVNLAGYWPLNRTIGGTDIELVTGGPVVENNGLVGVYAGHYYPYCRLFSPTAGKLVSDDRVGQNWNISGSFSISFWLNRSNVGNDRGVLQYLAEQASKNGYEIRITAGGVLQFIIYRNDTVQIRQITVGVADWQFVTCYYASTIDTMYIQLNNGVPVSSGTVLEPNYTAGGIMTIGNSDTMGNFLGRLESVALYDRILTDSERTFLYNSGKGMGYGGLTEENEIILHYTEKYQGV